MELGIKGHKTRGDEIIKILEMLGGKNRHEMRGGIYDKYFYYIDDEYKDISYSYIGPDEINGYKIFSLEDFLEKFPYKVGDKVNIYVQNDDIEGWFDTEVAEITSMRWNCGRCAVAYRMKEQTREFYKGDIKGKVDDKTSKNMEEKKINQMLLANCDLDEVEIVLGDRFELKIIDGKYYAVRKKPIYPKNYEECCDVLNIDPIRKIEYEESWGFRSINQFDTDILAQLRCFRKLIICRNAYWKIAGDKLGLDKPWEPDWNNLSTKHEFILINKDRFTYSSRLLVFPTVEMRDAFHNNFKFLIEQCKELL